MAVKEMIVTHFVEQDGMMVPADKLREKESPELVKFNGMIMTVTEYERKKGMQTGAEVQAAHIESLEGKAEDKGNEHEENYQKELKDSIESVEQIKQDLLEKNKTKPVEKAEKTVAPKEKEVEKSTEVTGEELDELKALRIQYKEATGKAIAPRYTKDVEYMKNAIAAASTSN